MMKNIENHLGRNGTSYPVINCADCSTPYARVCGCKKNITINRYIRPFAACVWSLGALSLTKRFIRPMKTKGPIGDFEKADEISLGAFGYLLKNRFKI